MRITFEVVAEPVIRFDAAKAIGAGVGRRRLDNGPTVKDQQLLGNSYSVPRVFQRAPL